MLVSLAVYHVDLCYGGPEEGGWYYQAGTLSESHPVMYFEASPKPAEGDHGPAIEWAPTKEAEYARAIVQGFLDAYDNFGAPPISASNSRGRLVAYLDVGHPVYSFPEEKPYYE